MVIGDDLEMQDVLLYALQNCDDLRGAKIRTFADSGLLTGDRGVRIVMPDGAEFQIPIVQAKKAK